MNKEKEMILNDNLWKVCYRLSLPAIIAMVLFGLNVIFDGIFVGRFVGETALAGISIVYPLTQIPLGLGSLVGVGAGSYLSILIGENDKKTQSRIIGNTNLILLMLTIIMMFFGFVFMKPLLNIIGATGEEYVYASNYFKITLFGSIFWIAGIGYNMIVRAEGRMKTAAIMMGIGLLINVLANYVFMVIFDFGVEGAAWGTNIGMFIYVLLFTIYSVRGKASFEVDFFRIYCDKEIIKEIISLGMPSFVMTIMTVIQGIIIMKALKTYGTTSDVAFYGVVFRLYNLFLTPIYGLMRALQPAVGVNFGAKQYDRTISAFKIFSFAALIVMLPLWLISMAFPDTVLKTMLPLSTFSSSEIMNFRVFISIAPMLSIVLTAMTFWPAIKKPKPAMLIGIGRQLLLYIPLMIILPMFFGVGSIYVGSFVIDFILTFIIMIMLKKEFGQLRKINLT
ncbi:MATE family efflux transporter [Lacrimispora sp. 38-1]|uniref:MATE family efflux transporter n=1 Tax=Lacrimispora sp. 38-1 TaxID=3125778 RepID=UPI003CEE7946